MRTLLCLSAVFGLLLCGCSNETETDLKSPLSAAEQAKIEKLMNLFDSYGWELDTTVSEERRNRELLKMDYEETKVFLDFMSKGFEMDDSI